MHVAIIGNGITGTTAARHLRQRSPDVRITLIGGESDHPWSRPALMYVYMGHLRREDTRLYDDTFWTRNRIDLVRGWVTGLDPAGHTLEIDGRTRLSWDRLLLATGSVPNRFGWPGEHLDRVSGLYGLQDLDALERWTPRIRCAAVVGGGLIGVELAEMLLSRGRAVTLLAREAAYWDNVLPAEEAAMVTDAIRQAGVDLRLSTELAAIEADADGGAAAVVTTAGERIPADYVGLTAGVRPNTAVCAGTGIAVGRGILVDDRLRTNVPDVYAAGDCAEICLPGGGPGLVQSVWYTGRRQGEVAAANLLGGDVAYEPGIWFNSARFFDLEHQVYGEVPSARDPGSTESVFWRDGDGRRSVRIVHRDGAVVGFNLLGVRLRHRVCARWIAERRPLEHVLAHFHEAVFDPELSRRVERHVRAAAR